jgi:signal transduction histidine kinase
VMEFIDMLDSLKIAGKLHHTHKAYFIVDNTTTGNIQHRKWMKSFKENAPEFEVTSLHLENYSFDEIIEKVKSLDEGVILMNVVGQDRDGHVEDNLVMTKKIAEISRLPIYVESSMRVGQGTIGGRVTDGESHGNLIAKKLVQYVKGDDSPPHIDARNNNLLMFDYPALERFGVEINSLPKESIILHRPLSIYEHYKTAIWFIGVLLIILISVITIQAIRIQNRRAFQVKLEEIVDQRTSELNLQVEEQKKLRKTLISREKLASLGNLTAGIAHEIKNPLNIIINSAQVIEAKAKLLPEQDSKPLTDINRMAQLIVKNSFRADSIIQNMLGQVRNAEAPVSLVDLNHLIDEAIALVYHASKAKYEINIGIKKDYGPLPEVPLSKENILRALINLMENSFYALNEKDKNHKNFSPLLEVKTSIEKKRALIEIKDNGEGIPSDVLEKVLHPFFTTKPAGVGTGLGLSMVNDIVSAHGGELEILTEQGKFTIVKMYLPLK